VRAGVSDPRSALSIGNLLRAFFELLTEALILATQTLKLARVRRG
jgi:hypothetical protein